MGYRKFAADYLFTGNEMLGKDAVLIVDETGKVHDIVQAEEIGDGVERYNGILSPGFINCHCHLELSHLKGMIPKHTGMVDFLVTVMNSRKTEKELVLESIAAEERFMREKGIVAVGDICNTDDTLETKVLSSLYFHNFIEAIGFVPDTAPKRFEQSRRLFEQFSEHLSATSIVPHAAYSVSGKLLSLIDEFDGSSLLTIHNQESRDESEFFERGTGRFLELYSKLDIDISHFKPNEENSFEYVLHHVSPSHTLILVHNVHTSVDDLSFIRRDHHEYADLWWCLCPNANLYISNELPDVRMLMQNGARIVVGTDSLASNVQLNILEELKTLQQHFPFIETTELLRWATANGAAALRISTRYGSFAKGKQPGIVIIHGGKGLALEGTVSRRIL